jgi:hypothetical protein
VLLARNPSRPPSAIVSLHLCGTAGMAAHLGHELLTLLCDLIQDLVELAAGEKDRQVALQNIREIDGTLYPCYTGQMAFCISTNYLVIDGTMLVHALVTSTQAADNLAIHPGCIPTMTTRAHILYLASPPSSHHPITALTCHVGPARYGPAHVAWSPGWSHSRRRHSCSQCWAVNACGTNTALPLACKPLHMQALTHMPTTVL